MLQHFSCEQNADLISWSEMILALFQVLIIHFSCWILFFFLELMQSCSGFFQATEKWYTVAFKEKEKKIVKKRKKIVIPFSFP